MSAETEESIRGLVYSVTHDRVNDLREEFAVGMLSTLNSKVNMYGVQIMNVKITDVKLPPDLQDRLEKTTAFKTKMSEQEKIHENRVRVLEDEATRSIETIRKSNARKLQEITADRKRYEIERREMEETARGRARVEEIKAMTEADVALKKSLGCETVEKVKARQDAEALMKKTHIICQTMKIEAEQKVTVDIKNSEAELAVAESRAVRVVCAFILHSNILFLATCAYFCFDVALSFQAAMIVRAEAESDGAEALKEKRRYELEWQRLKVLETIASSKSKKFITGKKGDAILNELIPEM
jgi:regulator of protease activity HflC (stomatin/prohibitin superfamily)